MGTITERPRLPIENLGEQHLPCVILVDTSHSMRGYEQQLTEAIRNLKCAIENDDTARGRVEVCLATYDDDVREESPFGAISKMRIPTISCGGMTRTHIAIKFALDRLAERKQDYVNNHVMYNQPWICLLTDGESNDADNGAFEELLDAQKSSKCVFFGIAIGDQANEKELAGMHKNGMVLKVEKDNLSSAFEFISQSVNPASAHNPGEKIKVEIPDGIEVKQVKPGSGSPEDKSKLRIYPVDKNSWSQDMPVIKEYDDRYDHASWDEVERKCAEGDPYALYEKASRLRVGEGVEVDKVQALYYYGLVLQQQKNTRALYNGGLILNEDYHSDYCVKYFRLGSELGDYDCSYELGNLYRYGDYVESDPETAIRYFQLSSQQGEPKNIVSAGEVCLDLQDYQRAIGFLTTAIQSGEPLGAFYLGRMYYHGTGVQEDNNKAFIYLKQYNEAGFNDGNLMLAVLYGYGEGTTKDVNLAMKLLDDVPDNMISDACLMKARIWGHEGNNHEVQRWLNKAAEMGNDEAQRLLREGVGKTDEELANEGTDPYAMIRYSGSLMFPEKGNKPDTRKAIEVITRAANLFPENLDVRRQYALLYATKGHVALKIGAYEDAFNMLTQSISEAQLLRSRNYDPDFVNMIENNAYMDCGTAAFYMKKYDVAQSMLMKTDQNKNPYATVILLCIHLDEPNLYGIKISDEINAVKKSINTETWDDPGEKAMAYYILAGAYSKGVPNYLKANTNYAYECINKCAELDPELAKSEIGRYSKNIFGSVTYK